MLIQILFACTAKKIIYISRVTNFRSIDSIWSSIYLKVIDTKIHTREQLEKLMPNFNILGEVPFVEDVESIMDSRGIFAESSRVIRSNIGFKLNKK